MSSAQDATLAPAALSADPPRALVLLLATGAGLGAAAIYYSQPILGILGSELNADERLVGMVPMLTQFGYALGILLLTPLGDRYDRRKIIVLKALILSAALVASGLATGIASLLAISLAIGLAATVAQDIVPTAAMVAPEHSRGKIVGTVMTGLLLGILLSRVASGFIAEHLGWRSVYLLAAAVEVLIALAAWRGLPQFRPTTRLNYLALMDSMLQLWGRHPALRRAAIAQGLLSFGFSAFWSTLAVMLHHSFGFGSAAAGAYGLAGAAGALAAPLAGRLADRRGPELVARLGAALTALSFAAMGLMAILPPTWQLVLIALSAIGFDFGIQASLVAHQTIVFSIEPGARSRLNALLFSGVFIGMATGAGLGSLALAEFGWQGVLALATAVALAALAVRLAKSAA